MTAAGIMRNELTLANLTEPFVTVVSTKFAEKLIQGQFFLLKDGSLTGIPASFAELRSI